LVEKVGHIKNPLTVIAIFAALAEVSGTAVLPMLQKETQQVYVWFLMIFPIFLVASFFFVLYKRHHVMYAPTDFKDDKTFKDLFENSNGSAKIEKIKNETEELVNDSEKGALSADKVIHSIGPGEADATGQPAISASETLRRTFQGNSLLAEELVVAKLSKDQGLKFDRNLSVKGLSPKLEFDAVATSEDRAVVVEIRFTRAGMMNEEMRRNSLDQIVRFANTLPQERRSHLEYIFALVTDSEDDEKVTRMQRTVQRMQETAKAYSFKTTVHFFRMKDLESEFIVR
jgi:Holliday junction resolvase-like predicted endonuclease